MESTEAHRKVTVMRGGGYHKLEVVPSHPVFYLEFYLANYRFAQYLLLLELSFRAPLMLLLAIVSIQIR